MKKASIILLMVLLIIGCQTAPKLTPEEAKAKWRGPVLLSALNAATCTGLQETGQKIQAQETDGFAAFGELMAIGLMIRLVDEGLAQAEPTADQEDLMDQIQADVDSMRSIVGPWVNQETTAADILPLLDETCPDITATFEEVIAVAEDEGLTREAAAQIMEEMSAAFESALEPEEGE